jgi:tetratricopeptide (TPR) repeat protein
MLNEIQQLVLQNLFKSYILSKISSSSSQFDKLTCINILLSITNDTVFLQNYKIFERYSILENVQYFRDVFAHSCPQNVATSFVPDTLESKSNLVKYKDPINGNIVTEQKGILGLTSLNDITAEPVTKEDVINYLQNVIEEELASRGYQQGSSDVVDLDMHEVTNAVSEISFSSIRSQEPPEWLELSNEARSYWKSLTILLETEQLFSTYNDVKAVWTTFNSETQQRVVSELQSMTAECLVLYDTSINLLLKFGIARTQKTFNVTDYTNYIQQLLESVEQSRRQTNLLSIFYFSRGFSYSIQQNFEEAISDYSKTLALTDDFLVAYNNRGLAYSELKKIDRALADFTSAIELRSDYAIAYFNRAIVYEQINKPWDALLDVKRAYQLQSTNHEFYAKYKKLRAIIESML